MALPYILLSILWVALIVYATFGGADFGAGLWDLFTPGAQSDRRRELVNQAIGPVWEANHVWLVFLVVGLFSAFPKAFSTLCIVLIYPLIFALIGIVLRGSSFIFRTHGLRARPTLVIWNRVFSFSSILTPFFLGVSAAAVASGGIQTTGNVQANFGSLWLTPFAIVIGLMAVSLCATLAAVFLIVEAMDKKEPDLVILFRLQALIAGAATAVLGAVGLALAPVYAPVLWAGMLNHALPVVIATMLIGLATAITLYFGYYRIARALIIVETAFLLGSWGVSQLPYIIPPSVTIEEAAGAPSTLLLLLIGIIVGMLLVIPSIYFLFYIFKFQGAKEGVLQQGTVPKSEQSGGLPLLK
jgi:cytochrome d ubiquinol oxidase subunit II